MNVTYWLSKFLVALTVMALSSAASVSVGQQVKEETPTEQASPKRLAESNLGQTEVMRSMLATSEAFRAAADKIRPALVTIESFGGISAIQGKIGGIRKQGEGNTTGVMISPDGYVLTSTFNFIQQPPVITVIPHDGRRRFAKIIGRDDTRKICLLKIEGVENMPVPEMVPVDQIRVGQWSVSLGVGYGDTSPALSMGIISAKNRVGGRAIQTDANVSPANYGGPLVDVEGRMLGICVPMNPQSQAVGAGVEWYDSGIGFAIPLAGTEKLIERLKQGERIYPAFLGIQAVPNPKGKGLKVEKVVADSPAEKSGLKKEDVIEMLNGQDVTDMLRLRQILNRFESGQEIELAVRKPKKKQLVRIKVKLDTANAKDEELNPLQPPKIR